MGFSALTDRAKTGPPQRMAVAWPADAQVLQAAADAQAAGLLEEVYLAGRTREVHAIAEEAAVDLKPFILMEAQTPEEAALVSVELVRNGKASVLMKGLVNTSTLLRAVLDRDRGLRTGKLLSHIAIIEFPGPRLRLLTDGGMNIAPDLEEKARILENAGELAELLDMPNPKAAVLASVELVNSNMPATMDAAVLTQMNQRGQLCIPMDVDGPLAYDNAVSGEAAEHKGICSRVAGQADILLVPEITAGNVLYKSLVYTAGLDSAGLVWGALAPIVLTSRADSRGTKLNSIAAACRACQEGGA